MNREGRAVLYVTAVVWLLFGYWPAFFFICWCQTAFYGDESFEEEDIPLTEKMTYLLPPHDMDILDLEGHLSYLQRTEPEAEERLNL